MHQTDSGKMHLIENLLYEIDELHALIEIENESVKTGESENGDGEK